MNAAEKSTNAIREWTIMVYMMGDNNLNDDMIRSINEMAEAIESTCGSMKTRIDGKNAVGFVVEFDGEHPMTPTRRQNLTYYPDVPYASSTKPTEVPDSVSSTGGSGNDPIPKIEDRVKNFVEYAVKAQPAKNYALILSGHSDAFLGKTLLIDENPGGVATIGGLSKVLSDLHGENPAFNLEILGFDGCVMNTIEVIYEFKSVTKSWIGSQGSIPNYTWDYYEIAKRLVDTESSALSRIEILEIIRKSLREYNYKYAFGGRAADIGYCEFENDFDPTKLGRALKMAAHYFLLLFGYYFPEDPVISGHIQRVLLLAHWNCQSFMRNQAVDLIDFFSRVSHESHKSINELRALHIEDGDFEPGTRASQENEYTITDSLEQRVEHGPESVKRLSDVLTLVALFSDFIAVHFKTYFKGSFVGADYRYSNGVSVFLPWSFLSYRISSKEYAKLRFSSDFGLWNVFLALYVRITARPPQTANLRQIIAAANPEADLTKFLSESLEIFNMLKVADRNFEVISKELFDAEAYNLLDSLIDPMLKELMGDSDTKDNPNRTRGLESYLYYFERTNNIFPELDQKGDYP